MAIGPINYLAAMPQEDFLRDIQGGLQLGSALQTRKLQQQEMARKLALQQAYQQDVTGFMANPTADAALALSLKYPDMHAATKEAFGAWNSDRQQSELRDIGTLAAALKSGRHDVALGAVNRRIDTLKNAGQPSQEFEMLRDSITKDQEGGTNHALGTAMVLLPYLPGGKEVLANIGTLGTEQRAQEVQPYKVREAAAGADKADAEAVEAGIKAANAPTATALSNQTAREKIETARTEREIARLDTQIKQANSETERGRLQLQRAELQAKLDEKKLTQGTEAQDQVDTVRQSLETVSKIMDHPGASGFFYGPGTIGGKMTGFIPGTDRKDLEGLVTTLKSQQFLTGVKQMTGMGALSEKEGDKIGSAVASLDLDQSPAAFKIALGVIQANLKRAEAKLQASGKLSATGGAFVMRHPTYGNVTEGQINRLMQQNPGATREQVIQFLQSTGGK